MDVYVVQSLHGWARKLRPSSPALRQLPLSCDRVALKESLALYHRLNISRATNKSPPHEGH
jgi:hypothetical protein